LPRLRYICIEQKSVRTGGVFEMSKNVTRPCILIVSDEPALSDLFRVSLKVRDSDVLVSPGCPDVFAIVQNEQPDLVILELTVRGVDGFELCRQICQDSSSSVIAFNMWGNESELLRCLEMGVDDYLGKPFGVAELTARVRAVLRRTMLARPSPPSVSGDQITLPASGRIQAAGYYLKACADGKDVELKRMNFINILVSSIPLSMAENWESACTELVDRPLSAAYWKLEELTGERFLNELVLLQVEPGKILSSLN
jgi:DNA-binding response OmpR family regulator